MKILLVYPNYPDTFWSFKYALKFISKKASLPPLGLLTIASMLPPEWEKRLIDINVNPLKDKDLLWADYVFISAMSIQKESVKTVISRCKALGVKIVAGGPLFTSFSEEFKGTWAHFVLDEAEITLPPFLDDLKKRTGQTPLCIAAACRHQKYSFAAVGTCEFKKICINEHPVFKGMPV